MRAAVGLVAPPCLIRFVAQARRDEDGEVSRLVGGGGQGSRVEVRGFLRVG